MNIGTRINELRKSSNLTMQQLSELSGISQPVLSKLENGNRTADIPTIEKICRSLNLTLLDFFNIESASEPLSPQLKELLNNVKELSPIQLEALNITAKAFKNRR